MDTAGLFLMQLGIGGIFLGTVIEALGIPFPGGVMLILAGILVYEGKIGFFAAFLTAVAGLNAGAIAAYFIGRGIGEPFLYRFEKLFRLERRKLDRAREWLTHSAAAFVLLGRFVPTVGNVTPYLAGISRLSPTRFIFYNCIFSVGWSLFNMGLGYYFSRTWQVVWRYVETYLPYLAAGLILVYLGVAALIKRKVAGR
jgi:membrane protein DedA with SNARE-associated domain